MVNKEMPCLQSDPGKLLLQISMDTLELYPHNQKAYESARTLIKSRGKAAVIHPTGTGKSFLGFKLAEEHPGKRILWLSPSEYIFQTQVENLRRALASESHFQRILAGICFMTYSRLMMRRENRMRGENRMREVTEPLQIQTERWQPDYIILDEFHRCGAREWEKSVKELLSAFPKAGVLGLSATSVRYLDGQRDMAQELFDGCIASEMSLGEAIAREILPAPKYVISLYSCQEEWEHLKKRVDAERDPGIRKENEKLLEELRRTLEHAEGLQQVFYKHMKDPDGSPHRGRYIVFCSGREQMEEMKDKAKEWFSLVDPDPHLYAMYHDSPQTDREFDTFKKDESGHLRLLFCIDMLNEGVHVEQIDGVILLRPTVSPIVYLQQIGRALSVRKGSGFQNDPQRNDSQRNDPQRTLPHEHSVPQSPPVIFDIVNNFESLYMMDTLWMEMEEAFSVLPCTETQRKMFAGHFQVSDETRNCRELFGQLNRNLTAVWDRYYQAAEAYYREHGNLHMAKSYVTDSGLTVGAWLMTQRRIRAGKAAGKLTEEQIRRLDAAGMEWEAGPDRKWKRGYEALCRYKEQYGDVDVNCNYVTEEGYALGKWVSNLRSKWKRGELESKWKADPGRNQKEEKEPAGVPERRIEEKDPAGKTEEADPDREIPNPKGIPDRESLQEHTPAAQPVLITLEQQRLLEELGMIWDKYTYRWEVNFHNAEQYYKEHGDLDAPRNYRAADGSTLGVWLENQRRTYAGSKQDAAPLSRQQVERLEGIGMKWRKDKGWKHKEASAGRMGREEISIK